MNMKPIYWLSLLLGVGLILATVSCRHSPAKATPTGDSLPTAMELSWIRALMLKSTEVVWTNQHLSFRKDSAWLRIQGKAEPVTITPSTAAWETLGIK
jgi:hypothetical protein